VRWDEFGSDKHDDNDKGGAGRGGIIWRDDDGLGMGSGFSRDVRIKGFDVARPRERGEERNGVQKDEKLRSHGWGEFCVW